MINKRKLIKGSDLIVICAMLLIALSVYVWRGLANTEKASMGLIYVDGVRIKTVDLTQDAIFSLDDLPNVVFEVRKSAIAFVQSDCPDKTCIKSGFLKHIGQVAACLPNLISITVSADESVASPDNLDDPDMVAF